MAGDLTGWGGVGTRVFDQMFNTMARQIEMQQRQVAEHQIAQVSMTKASLDAFKTLTPVQALVAAAHALHDYGLFFETLNPTYSLAAAKFTAEAANWGTVSAFQVASMGFGAIPGKTTYRGICARFAAGPR
jgi:hypothetical protein